MAPRRPEDPSGGPSARQRVPLAMIEHRPARPSDAEVIADLHARSWRENDRGAFRDEFLDGDLPAERLQAWRERLDHPPVNQLVQLSVAHTNLVGFVCACGAHDPQWGLLRRRSPCCPCLQARRDWVGAHEASRSPACLPVPRAGGLPPGPGGQRRCEAFLRAAGCSERRRIHQEYPRWRRGTRLSVYVATRRAAVCSLTRRCS